MRVPIPRLCAIASRWRVECIRANQLQVRLFECGNIPLCLNHSLCLCFLAIAKFLSEPFDGGLPIAYGLAEAGLDDIIPSLSTEEGINTLKTICDAFKESKCLKEVNLSDNAIGEQAIGACRTVLNKKTLEKISMCNCGLAFMTMVTVADILLEDTDGTGCVAANLTSMVFSRNMSGDEGGRQVGRILEKTKRLRHLRFAGTRVSSDGSELLASAFESSIAQGNNLDIEHLDLVDNCTFSSTSSHESLFRAIGALNKLTYLNLGSSDLGDEGVKKICHALFENDSSLAYLNLSYNDIEKKGAKHVADYLKDCGGKLKTLVLDGNMFDSRGALTIAKAFHSNEDPHSIEELSMNECMIGAIGARALIDAYGPEGKDLPNLKTISLNENSFTEEIVGELEVALGGKLLPMPDNDEDGDADDDLSDDDFDGDDEDETSGSVDDLTAAMNKVVV